jgi:hypothetical protein
MCHLELVVKYENLLDFLEIELAILNQPDIGTAKFNAIPFLVNMCQVQFCPELPISRYGIWPEQLSRCILMQFLVKFLHLYLISPGTVGTRTFVDQALGRVRSISTASIHQTGPATTIDLLNFSFVRAFSIEPDCLLTCTSSSIFTKRVYLKK